MTGDEMVGWHHRLDGQEFEKAQGGGDGQGSLACCSPRGHKESDTTEQLNNNNSLSGFSRNKNHVRQSMQAHTQTCINVHSASATTKPAAVI